MLANQISVPVSMTIWPWFPFCAQSCEYLEVYGVGLATENQSDVFVQQIIVTRGGSSGEGNLIAEEQVMYFGIAGTSYHVLEMTHGKLSITIDVTLELWLVDHEMAWSWMSLYPSDLKGMAGFSHFNDCKSIMGQEHPNLDVKFVCTVRNIVLSNHGCRSGRVRRCHHSAVKTSANSILAPRIKSLSIEFHGLNFHHGTSHWSFLNHCHQRHWTHAATTFQIDLSA